MTRVRVRENQAMNICSKSAGAFWPGNKVLVTGRSGFKGACLTCSGFTWSVATQRDQPEMHLRLAGRSVYVAWRRLSPTGSRALLLAQTKNHVKRLWLTSDDD